MVAAHSSRLDMTTSDICSLHQTCRRREGNTVSVSGIRLRATEISCAASADKVDQGLTWRSLRAPRRLERRYTVRALGVVLNKSTTHAESAVHKQGTSREENGEEASHACSQDGTDAKDIDRT